MIRLAGAALVVGAAALMGEAKAGEVREQYTRLLGLQRVICSLQGEMGYARSYLGEIFARIGAQEEEPYRSWLLELSRELERRKGGSFHRIWEESIKRHLKDIRLPTRELDRLKSLGLELRRAEDQGKAVPVPWRDGRDVCGSPAVVRGGVHECKPDI